MSDGLLPGASRLERVGRIALVVGAVCLGLCAVGGFLGPQMVGTDSSASWLFERAQFFRSYLVGFLFVLALGLGSMAILMVHHLTEGAWGAALRGVLEAATRTMPVLGVLFLPVLLGMNELYPWTHWDAEEVAGSHVLQTKRQYLNPTGFVIRAAIYFAIWIGLALLLNRRAWADQSPEAQRRLRRLSGPGLGLYGLTMTFAAVDWIMSLEPYWYSTIFGMLVTSTQVLTAFAFGVLALVELTRQPDGSNVFPASKGNLQDLGSLLLAFVMLWAYLAFSQFLLIWSGNLPEEVPWYLKRLAGGWQVFALMLLLLQFVLPFFLLLSRDIKRNARRLAAVAGVVLAMRVVDLYWMVVPAFFPYQPVRLHWMDVFALAGLGGLWLAVFLYELRRRPVVPAENGAERREGGHE